MGTMMSLALKAKLAVVQLASDWQNGETYTSDRFHFQEFSFRVFLLVIPDHCMNHLGGEDNYTIVFTQPAKEPPEEETQTSSGREDGISNQVGNLRWGFSFFFHNLLLDSTGACLLINYSGVFTFQQQANGWFSFACFFDGTPFA